MDYIFPIIKTIDDVLPHIAGRDEFVVAEKDGYTVVNYNVSMPDTFPPIKVAGGTAKMREARSLTNRMRRECRGLIFNPDGKIMSRPFHKFFNVNERDETQSHKIDLLKTHTILEKMDGSMIRPLRVNGKLRLGTKMGITDVSILAEKWLHAKPKLLTEFMDILLQQNVTPIYEFVAPNNRIVIDYKDTDLVLLAMRHNITGEYLDISQFRDVKDFMFTLVPAYGSITGEMSDYVDTARQRKNREGDVIIFDDGHMVKIKNDWYVQLHRTKDMIRFERNLVRLIVEENVDDVKGFMMPDDLIKVQQYEIDFWNLFDASVLRTEELIKKTLSGYKGDKKAFALASKNWKPFNKTMVFNHWDGGDVRASMMQRLVKTLFTNTKFKQEKDNFIPGITWNEVDQ